MEHGMDLPLAILVSVLVIKECFALVKVALMRRTSHRATTEGDITPNHYKALLAEVNRLRDAIDKVWEKLGEVSERLARLEK